VESGWPSVGKVREWYVTSQHLQGCSLHLYWLRTNGLPPASKYWIYRSHAGVISPVNWCSILSIGAWLSLLLQWLFLWEKLGGAPADHSVGLGVVSGAFFLWSSSVCPTLWITCERLSRTWTSCRKRMQGICGLAWKVYTSYVWGFPL
jgi:hypothetical protein